MNSQLSTVRAAAAAPVHVGEHLRQWRQRRHLSQLDLAGEAEVSARHLSFVETGRAERTFLIGDEWCDSIYMALPRPTA